MKGSVTACARRTHGRQSPMLQWGQTVKQVNHCSSDSPRDGKASCYSSKLRSIHTVQDLARRSNGAVNANEFGSWVSSMLTIPTAFTLIAPVKNLMKLALACSCPVRARAPTSSRRRYRPVNRSPARTPSSCRLAHATCEGVITRTHAAVLLAWPLSAVLICECLDNFALPRASRKTVVNEAVTFEAPLDHVSREVSIPKLSFFQQIQCSGV